MTTNDDFDELDALRRGSAAQGDDAVLADALGQIGSLRSGPQPAASEQLAAFLANPVVTPSTASARDTAPMAPVTARAGRRSLRLLVGAGVATVAQLGLGAKVALAAVTVAAVTAAGTGTGAVILQRTKPAPAHVTQIADEERAVQPTLEPHDGETDLPTPEALETPDRRPTSRPSQTVSTDDGHQRRRRGGDSDRAGDDRGGEADRRSRDRRGNDVDDQRSELEDRADDEDGDREDAEDAEDDIESDARTDSRGHIETDDADEDQDED